MTLVMNQLLDSKLTEDEDEERKDSNTSMKEQEDDTMVLGHKDIMETNLTTRIQGLAKENSLMLPNIKRLQRNIRKFQNNPSANKIPKFTITNQNPRQTNMFTKPNEEKINNVKPNLTEHKMDYDIVEDIKKVRENISLFQMCKVPQQKEKLLKALEVSEKRLPTNNQPLEEE